MMRKRLRRILEYMGMRPQIPPQSRGMFRDETQEATELREKIEALRARVFDEKKNEVFRMKIGDWSNIPGGIRVFITPFESFPVPGYMAIPCICPSGAVVELHHHKEEELFIPLEGKYKVSIGHNPQNLKEIIVERGEMLLFRSWEYHRVENIEGGYYLIIANPPFDIS